MPKFKAVHYIPLHYRCSFKRCSEWILFRLKVNIRPRTVCYSKRKTVALSSQLLLGQAQEMSCIYPNPPQETACCATEAEA